MVAFISVVFLSVPSLPEDRPDLGAVPAPEADLLLAQDRDLGPAQDRDLGLTQDRGPGPYIDQEVGHVPALPPDLDRCRPTPGNQVNIYHIISR